MGGMEISGGLPVDFPAGRSSGFSRRGDHTRLAFLQDGAGKVTSLVLNPGAWQIAGRRINNRAVAHPIAKTTNVPTRRLTGSGQTSMRSNNLQSCNVIGGVLQLLDYRLAVLGIKFRVQGFLAGSRPEMKGIGTPLPEEDALMMILRLEMESADRKG
jgi:hypothetical protein